MLNTCSEEFATDFPELFEQKHHLDQDIQHIIPSSSEANEILVTRLVQLYREYPERFYSLLWTGFNAAARADESVVHDLGEIIDHLSRFALLLTLPEKREQCPQPVADLAPGIQLMLADGLFTAILAKSTGFQDREGASLRARFFHAVISSEALIPPVDPDAGDAEKMTFSLTYRQLMGQLFVYAIDFLKTEDTISRQPLLDYVTIVSEGPLSSVVERLEQLTNSLDDQEIRSCFHQMNRYLHWLTDRGFCGFTSRS